MKFGPSVLDIVEACTDADVQPKPKWTKRKEDYIAGVSHKSASAVLVASADKVHNARAVLRDFRTQGKALWSRFNVEAGEAGTLGFYRGIADVLCRRASALSDARLIPIVDELDVVVTSLEKEVGFKGVWPPARRDAD